MPLPIQTRQLNVERLTVISSKSFESVVAAFEAAIGHPDTRTFQNNMGAAKTFADLEALIHGAVGPSGFLEFVRFNLGAVLRKESGRETPKIMRFVIGNPLVMKEMGKHVPDAASYAPVTVLIDERADGVHLSYDKMASLLASYGSAEALKVARELDSKVETLLLETAA
ncbi:MAG TPA: DUF302 domain-containing protein [Bryobacteraceae bacterium]|jgi:uncharacterized protein (DUF302 family)|nr:DUF302 domain-containing protein [Bryobacteraceae bacterium]